MCVSAVWSVRLLRVWALNFFRWLGWLAVAWAGAGCCSALHVPPGRVSPALVLLLPVVDACGLVLVQVMPCRAACWCSGLGSRVRLSLLAVYCIGGGRCPACGLLAAVWWGCSRSMPCSVKAKKRGSSLAAVPLWCLIIWVICGCVVPSGDFGYCYDNTGYN